MPERRQHDDSRERGTAERPRRSTDDLGWLRAAYENPAAYGLRPVPVRSAVAAWEPDAVGAARLKRLSSRRVLEAAGFLLS